MRLNPSALNIRENGRAAWGIWPVSASSPARIWDGLQAYLKQHGVGSEVYYPLPLHLQTCFAHLRHKAGDFPVSERLAQSSLALPIYSELERTDIEYICSLIASFYGERKAG